uniref:Peptidase_S8 domain-containing protein n=1 Tax=Heterorhabditis bacteriophora TaxID=37862 RepID=A0A1I7XFY7_HETBA
MLTGDSMKRSLVLLAVFLCFLLVLSLLILVLIFGGDSTSIDYDHHTALDEGDGVFGRVIYDEQVEVNTWASTHGVAILEKMYQKTDPPKPSATFIATTNKTPITSAR